MHPSFHHTDNSHYQDYSVHLQNEVIQDDINIQIALVVYLLLAQLYHSLH